MRPADAMPNLRCSSRKPIDAPTPGCEPWCRKHRTASTASASCATSATSACRQRRRLLRAVAAAAAAVRRRRRRRTAADLQDGPRRPAVMSRGASDHFERPSCAACRGLASRATAMVDGLWENDAAHYFRHPRDGLQRDPTPFAVDNVLLDPIPVTARGATRSSARATSTARARRARRRRRGLARDARSPPPGRRDLARPARAVVPALVPEAAVLAAWGVVAERFGADWNVVGADLFNEPTRRPGRRRATACGGRALNHGCAVPAARLRTGDRRADAAVAVLLGREPRTDEAADRAEGEEQARVRAARIRPVAAPSGEKNGELAFLDHPSFPPTCPRCGSSTGRWQRSTSDPGCSRMGRPHRALGRRGVAARARAVPAAPPPPGHWSLNPTTGRRAASSSTGSGRSPRSCSYCSDCPSPPRPSS